MARYCDITKKAIAPTFEQLSTIMAAAMISSASSFAVGSSSSDAHTHAMASISTSSAIHASASCSLATTLDAARGKDDDDDSEYEELIPPENFAMIEKGLYRSACYCSIMLAMRVCYVCMCSNTHAHTCLLAVA